MVSDLFHEVARVTGAGAAALIAGASILAFFHGLAFLATKEKPHAQK